MAFLYSFNTYWLPRSECKINGKSVLRLAFALFIVSITCIVYIGLTHFDLYYLNSSTILTQIKYFIIFSMLSFIINNHVGIIYFMILIVNPMLIPFGSRTAIFSACRNTGQFTPTTTIYPTCRPTHHSTITYSTISSKQAYTKSTYIFFKLITFF